MPKTRTILQIFLASPSDLSDERAQAEEVVREFNATWSNTLNLYLELLRWETHGYSDTGEDAQEVLNKQIGSDYDIFLGILWSRFGTPTPRADSGTKEEFDNALRRFRENPDSVRIMFYFKETPISISKIDIEQATAIRKFREQLGERGSLYWTFDSPDEFKQLLRMHLSRQVQEWRSLQTTQSTSSGMSRNVGAVSVEDASVQKAKEDDEEGYVDLIAAGEENFETMTFTLNRMTEVTNDLSDRTSKRIEELNSLTRGKTPVQMRIAKGIFDKAGSDLEEFSKRTEPEIEIFARSCSEGIRSFASAISMIEFQQPVKREEAQPVLDTIMEFARTILDTSGKIREFKETLSSLPRFTSAYNRARKRAVALLDRLLSELTIAQNLAHELAELIRRLIEGSNGTILPI